MGVGVGLLISLILALLVTVGVAMLLRRCSVLVRVLVGGSVGVVCFFVFSIAATIIFFARSFEPPKKFDAATYTGQTGSISVPFQGDVTVRLQQSDESNPFKIIEVSGSNGVATAPTGQYRVFSYDVKALGRDGRAVSISPTYGGVGGPPLVTINPSANTALTGGPPLTASITVHQKGKDKVNMDLLVTGSANEPCTITGPDGKGPGFLVLSKSGQVLMQGNFAYG